MADFPLTHINALNRYTYQKRYVLREAAKKVKGKMQRRKIMQGLLSGAVFFLSGCLAVENIETPAEAMAASSSADSSIVYGRVRASFSAQ